MKTPQTSMTLLCVCVLLALCSNSPVTGAPRIDDLGTYHRAVTTDSAEAQRWFDQGLVMCRGFNHEAAIASFREAARLDPDSARPGPTRTWKSRHHAIAEQKCSN